MRPCHDNVILDAASTYGWEELNESEFLTKVFDHLQQEMGPQFTDFTFIVFSSPDADAIPASSCWDAPNKILFFISAESVDPGSIRSALALQPHYQWVFKSYLPCELPHTRVLPFQLGYVKGVPRHPVRPSADRHIGVFFSGNLNGNRVSLYRTVNPVLRRLPGRMAKSLIYSRFRASVLDQFIRFSWPDSVFYFSDGFRRGLPREEYARKLHDSQIVLCPRGFESAETFRHMEAMRAGAVVVSEGLPDTWFYRGGPFVTVPDWRLGVMKAKELLGRPLEIERRQEATMKWWAEVCCEQATARYIATVLRTGRMPSRPPVPQP